jgi:DNA-binding CsgD family transcriptional regulator
MTSEGNEECSIIVWDGFLDSHTINVWFLSSICYTLLLVIICYPSVHSLALRNVPFGRRCWEAEEVMDAIQAVNTGIPYYCSTVSDKLFGKTETSMYSRHKLNPPVFTLKEITVMQLVCKQFSIKEIAEQMDLSTRTVEVYRQHLQDKKGARNIVGVALYAVINQLVNVNEL